jgi:hypothetical protein
MKLEKLFGIILVFPILLFSCKPQQKDSDDTKPEIISLVEEWNKSHSSEYKNGFEQLYADSVFFYGTLKDKNSCISIKRSLLEKQPDFYQQIYGNIDIDTISNSEVKCSFVKRVTSNKETSDYPSYLIFKKFGNNWKITVESDLITDKNISKKTTIKDIPKDAVKGDYNGDGKPEYMWLVPPEITDGPDCVGECTSYIRFSDPDIPDIVMNNCIGGQPTNRGDLNKNGTDEIGILPDWFTSCWRDYYVWTFIGGKWITAVDPFPTHCDQWENDVIPIEIDPKKDGYVLIRYSELTEDDLIVKTKSVKIRK